jgi:phage antirepressor YoqD-like protein
MSAENSNTMSGAPPARVLRIADQVIRQDAAGRYCLNDLHRAAGGEKRYGPSYWMGNAQTRELIAEIGTTGIPAVATAEGAGGGTFVAKELVYAYAMWISPSFHLKVIRAYDAVVQGSNPMAALQDPATMRALLLGYAENLLALETTVAAQAPKVDAFARLAEASGLLNITNAAKAMQVRPSDLFDYLRTHQWIYRRPGAKSDVAYQHRIASGLLAHKTHVAQRGDGSDRLCEQVMVTPKGLAKLAELLGAVGRAS